VRIYEASVLLIEGDSRQGSSFAEEKEFDDLTESMEHKKSERFAKAERGSRNLFLQQVTRDMLH